MDTPVQRRIVWFPIRSNINRLVSDLLPSALNWFIHYVLLSAIVLHLKVNNYIMNNRWLEQSTVAWRSRLGAAAEDCTRRSIIMIS